MKKLMFLFLFLFIVSQGYSQTKFLTGTDSISALRTNNQFEYVYAELLASTNMESGVWSTTVAPSIG